MPFKPAWRFLSNRPGTLQNIRQPCLKTILPVKPSPKINYETPPKTSTDSKYQTDQRLSPDVAAADLRSDIVLPGNHQQSS
jgi:hypothetical protein